MNSLYRYLFFGLGFLLFSCNNNMDNSSVEKELDPETLLQTNFNGKLYSIPSPILTTLLLKELKTPYAPELLIDKPTIEELNHEYTQALYLGVLAADLGYASFYKDNSRIVKYLMSVEKLSTQLGLDKNFNKTFIQRYESNISTTDSLIQLSSEAFKNADSYLKNNDRVETSLLILIGGWVETIHIASNLAVTLKKPELVERIAEQKQTLETILSILNEQNIADELPKFVNAFNDLNNSYQNISMHYTYSEPSIDIANKLTTLNHSISFEVSEKTLLDIQQKIAVIRNLIIQ